ncbi:hypothetical protein BC829DRAFT_278112 [Chytridium lagenaria]|nr:hypothetical protein BC829DRAFT_278112 [Chytridium lagenaria]
MTGKETRELTDLSQASYQAALKDTTSHLMELRHNVRMLVSEAELNLVQLTRNLTLEKAKKAKAEEDKVASTKASEIAGTKIVRLKEVMGIMQEIRKGKMELEEVSLNGEITEDDLDASFTEHIVRLQEGFLEEYVEYNLDEVVVAAIAHWLKGCLLCGSL